ncbi:hypothetical protein AAEX28_00160 [Lentisphaerota bacterium WC36G]|nr:hypothetical protein LJT99_03040 [Lentisphaerae bacterium WC36]
MLSFCGQDKCKLDKNGRIKFSPRIISDFKDACSGNVVLHCLPEGAVAVYPEDVYLQMRRQESRIAEQAASSALFRRNMRRFGAFSQSEVISSQGRITIPAAYRDHGQLSTDSDVVIIGVEIGIEIWNLERWQQEVLKIDEYNSLKSEQEIALDLRN